MKILGVDCSGGGGSAAVRVDSVTAAHCARAMDRGHAEALVPMISDVLAASGCSLRALDLIAVTTGPGAFTGLRIGLATVRGLALASGLPAVGVSSFAAVAAAVPEAERVGRTLVVALESKRAEFFLQAFAPSGTPIAPGALVAPSDLPEGLPPGSLLVAGDAAGRLLAALPEERAHAVVLSLAAGRPDAADVARLGEAQWREGAVIGPLRPLYLRPPDTSQPRLRGTRPT